MNDQLTTTESPFTLTSLDAARELAKEIADSGCFGIKKPSQALTLMMLAFEEKTTLSALLRKVHVFDDGKLSQRADYTQSAFEQNGTIIWHVRTPEMVAGSFFKIKPIDDKARERAMRRFELQWQYDALTRQPERDGGKEGKLILELSRLAYEGEATIIRTFQAAEESGITQGKNGMKNNWAAGAVSMLQWRCVTDGVKLIDPSVLSGLSSDVDLDDAKTVEQKTLTERASAPQSNDLEAMRSILAQHEADALTALSHGNERETKRLQGLASDMRVLIQEAEEKLKPTPQQRKLTPIGPAHEKMAKLEPADDVPMHHPADPPVETHLDGIQTATDVDSGKKVAVPSDLKPVKDTKKVEKQPESKPEPTPEPAGRSNEPIAHDLSRWNEYVLCKVPPGPFKGKKLGDCSKIEIGVLYKKRCIPLLNHPEADMKLEALMIQQAHDGGPAK